MFISYYPRYTRNPQDIPPTPEILVEDIYPGVTGIGAILGDIGTNSMNPYTHDTPGIPVYPPNAGTSMGDILPGLYSLLTGTSQYLAILL